MVSVFLFSIAISVDAFSVAIGFGINGLKFNLIDCIFVNLINALSLFISIVFSRSVFLMYSHSEMMSIGSFFLLFLGLYNLVNFFIDKKFPIALFGKKQQSDTLNKIFIVLLLCLESIVSGFSLLAYTGNIFLLLCMSFVFHTLFLFLGLIWGRSIANTHKIDVSWLSGIIFILLAISKFFG